MYYLMKQVFVPRSTKIATLRTEDSNNLLTDMDGMAKRWKKHFDRLLVRPSNVDPEVIKKISQRPIVIELDSQPLLGEILHGMEGLNMGRAVGVDGLPAEIFHYDGTHLSQLILL